MMIKPLLALSLLSILLALTGCGGSSSSSYNATSQTNVALANTSKFDYAQVSIVNSEGNETFFVDNINCLSGATSCYVNLDTAINAGDTLLFKNASGVMVAAITAAESSSGYTALSPSAMSTGFYLVSRLSSELSTESEIDWDEFNQRTLTFFSSYDSPDGSADPYEEVGDYYASRITKAAASERAFLDAFKIRLLNWDVAASNELPGYQTAAAKFFSKLKPLYANNSFTLISQAHAQEAPCSPVLSKFLSIAGAVGKVVPVVGEAISGAGKLGESYCKGPSADTKLIVSQLNDLKNSVRVVSRTIAILSKFIFEEAVNTKTTEFQKLAEDAENFDKAYNEFLGNNKVASLEQFFEKEGSWQAGLTKGDVALRTILNWPYTASGAGLYTRITQSTTLANFDSYLAALSSRCSQLTVSSDDNFLITRQRCNNAILANSGMLVAAQSISLPIFKDIYATLYKYQAQAANTYLLPSDFTSYASAYNDAVASFKAQQVDMISNYARTTGTTASSDGGRGFFDAFAGLNTTLMSNLVARQCNQSDEPGASGERRSFPAIVGWYAPGSTDGNQSFIETKCKVPTLNERIYARYFYNDQGAGATPSNVGNVLGVPIAAIYLENDRPLANSQANISSESIAWDPSQPLYLDTPSVNVFGIGSPPIGGLLVSPTTLPKSPNGGRYSVLRFGEIVWVRVRLGEGKNWYVAKIGLSFLEGADRLKTYYTDLSCLTVPCRVNPNNNDLGLWLEGITNGLKLDLVDTYQTVSGGHLLKLETR
jgi:hypothetical protein